MLGKSSVALRRNSLIYNIYIWIKKRSSFILELVCRLSKNYLEARFVKHRSGHGPADLNYHMNAAQRDAYGYR